MLQHPKQTAEIVRALSALAHASRLDIFQTLVLRGHAGFNPGELAVRLQLSPAAVSFHLKELAGSGLVQVRRESRFLFYRADFERVETLLSFLTENCCEWADRAATEAEQP